MKNPSAVALGRRSAQKRLDGMTKEQKSEYMKRVRSGIKNQVKIEAEQTTT